MGRHELGYAQARMQARYGERPDAATWQQLHGSRELGHFLEAARATGLRRWLSHVGERSDAHAVERGLRRELRDHAMEVAEWVPSGWRAAVRWTAHLVDVPALERLLGPEPPPPWAAADPVLADLAAPERQARIEAMRSAGLGAIVDAVEEGRPARAGWLDRWRALLPVRSGGRARELDAFVGRVQRHLESMGEDRDADGWPRRAALERDLAAAFRWQGQRPVAVWAYLGLTGLELERLRGAIVRRHLFPEIRSEVAWV